MIKRAFIFITLLSMVCGSLSAQHLWSLEECIQFAIDNNIQIKQQSLNQEFQKNTLLADKLSVLPSLNASTYESLRFGRSVDPFTNEFSTDFTHSTNGEISARMDLFSGGRKYHQIERSELNLQASIMDLEKAKNDVQINIANAFFNVLYNTELVEVSKNQVDITKLQLENTKKLVDAGSLARKDLLEIQSLLANEELQVVMNQNALDIAYLNLKQTLQLDTLSDFQILIPNIDIAGEAGALPSPDQIYAEAIIRMPEIKRSELDIAIARKDLSIARSRFYPSLSVSASYGSGFSSARQVMDKVVPAQPAISGYAVNENGEQLDVYSFGFDYTYKQRGFYDQIKDNASSSVAFGLSIPLFNGWQSKTGVNNAKVNFQSKKYSHELSQKKLRQEIQQAFADANASMKKYIATEKALSAMQESFKYTQKSFNIGMVTSVDYNVAKNQLSKNESDLLRSKYEFVFKQKILDFYRGIPITISQ